MLLLSTLERRSSAHREQTPAPDERACVGVHADALRYLSTCEGENGMGQFISCLSSIAKL